MTRLSTLQYNMLRMFASEGNDYHMSVTVAQGFDQRPFRSMLIQQWVSYRIGKGFHITRKGRDAYRDFESHDITRKNPHSPLTAFFDPEKYGLKRTKRKAERKAERKIAVLREVQAA